MSAPETMRLEGWLARMVELEASDLFLTVGAPPTASVEKRLIALEAEPLGHETVAAVVEPFLEGERRAAFEARPDIDLAHASPSGRFRVNIFRQRGEPGMVVRRVKLAVPSIESLGLPSVLARYALELRGLFLITGAAATGKSTTLAAMIDHRNERLPGHIVLVEDPVEFVHAHKRAIVTQREVGIDTGSFHDALRSALRQAPDVLAIGEVRDRETAESALHFAETGHLVLATMHATNTTQAIERLVNLFPKDLQPYLLLQLSLSLLGVASQRLVTRRDHPTRIAAVEVLEPTERVRSAVRRGDLVGVRAALSEGGGAMQSFDEALHALVASGRLQLDDAVRYADSPSDLTLRFSLERATGPERDELRQLRLV